MTTAERLTHKCIRAKAIETARALLAEKMDINKILLTIVLNISTIYYEI